MSEMVERVARAIREADIGYSIRLTRLVDDEATYTLTRPGHEPMEFASHDEALEHVSALRDAERARAAIEAMREPTVAILVGGNHCQPGSYSAEKVWVERIDTALSTPLSSLALRGEE